MRFALAGLLAASAVLAVPAVQAQAPAYPDRPVRIVVGAPPGGGLDIAARVTAQKLGERMGQQFIVENRPGAASNIGAETVARATPDGYTLLMAPSALAINATLYPNLTFDPVKDFAPVALVAPTDYYLVVNPAVQARTVAELIALARQKPGSLSFGSPGLGSAPHLQGELFKSMAGVDLLHVPYRGSGPAISDLVGGQISLMFADIVAVQPHVQAGRLRALATTTPSRKSGLADMPSVAETVPGYVARGWSGLLAPAGTPRPVVDRLNAEVVRMLAQPDVRERFAADGTEFGANTPADFAAFLKIETEKWGKVVRDAGVKPE